MTTIVVVNGHEWELFNSDLPTEPPKRGRPRGVESMRRAALIEKAAAEVVGEEYMAVAEKYQDEYYGELTVVDKASIEYYNQRKHVAKLVRKQRNK